MKYKITVCIVLTGILIQHSLFAQATYWQQSLTSDYYISGNSAYGIEGPWPVIATDRWGNIFTAHFVSGEGCLPCVSIDIEKFSSSGELINAVSYPVESQDRSGRLHLEADYNGNVYLYTTLTPPFPGSDEDIALVKYNASLAYQWEAHYPFAYDGLAGSGDLFIDNKTTPDIEIYITGIVLSGGIYQSFIARYNTDGVLVNMQLFPDSDVHLVQHRDGDIYGVGTDYSGSVYIIHVPEANAGYTTNLTDASTSIWLDYAYYPTDIRSVDIDRGGNIYILGTSWYGPLNNSIICSISPETGFRWSSKPFTDDPVASGWPTELWQMKVDPYNKYALYIAGLKDNSIKMCGVIRSSGTLYLSNIIDTAMIHPDYSIETIDHGTYAIDEPYAVGELKGRPLGLVVTPNSVYLESFGWRGYDYFVNTPEYIITKLSKNLHSCTFIDEIPITPSPANAYYDIAGFNIYSSFAHPYYYNSQLHLNLFTRQLSFAYTDRSYAIDDMGYTQFYANAYLRNYTSGYRETESPAEISTESTLSVYPNPAHQYVVLQSTDEEIYKYDIIDATGKLVQKGEFNGKETINLQSLATGIYAVRVYEGDTMIKTTNLIIQ